MLWIRFPRQTNKVLFQALKRQHVNVIHTQNLTHRHAHTDSHSLPHGPEAYLEKQMP